MKIIRDESLEIKQTYGDERRTEIIDAPDEILPEDMIQPEDMVVTVTHGGYIKRNSVDLYRSQRRGGKGIKGITAVEEDFVNSLYLASTHDTFLFFTNHGRVFWRKVYEIPLASRIARGKAIVNLLELSADEQVAAILPVPSFDCSESECYVLMVTKKGVVKKTIISEFARPMRKGKIALTIREDDEIISAAITNGHSEILLVSHKGMAVRFNEDDVRCMGRTATGVRGIKLAKNDHVVAAVVINSDESILVVTENGFGKRSPVEEYRLTRRGGKGVYAIKPSERNGNIVGACQITKEDEILLITDRGKIIRMDMSSVRVIGRATQGVTLINLEPGEKVVAMDRVPASDVVDDEEENEEESS
jgi:DNA gyrase subunit A